MCVCVDIVYSELKCLPGIPYINLLPSESSNDSRPAAAAASSGGLSIDAE